MNENESDLLAGRDLDYLKWAVEQQLGRIDAADDHIKDLHRRATVITGGTAALASFALPLLAPLNLWTVAVLALAVLGTGTCWWLLLMVGRSEDYDPAQFTDRMDEYRTHDFLNSVLQHMTIVAAAAQTQVVRKGMLLGRNWIVGGVSVLLIMGTLTFGVLKNGKAEDPADSPSGRAAQGSPQSPGSDTQNEGPPSTQAKDIDNGSKEEGK